MKQIQLTPTIIVTDGFINIPNRSDAFRLDEATEEQLDAITERTVLGKYKTYTHGLGCHTAKQSVVDRIKFKGFACYENPYNQNDFKRWEYWQNHTIWEPVINVINKNK